MAIYDREKMKQKVVYPTKQTPSYADWRLFEMGADLEDKVDSIPTSEPYTAGSGIAISDENVISNAAQPDVTKSYVDGVDVNLQQQIDAIVASSDVKDIVGTYVELQAYDTTTLGNNDIVKVLVDSTHSDAMGYYRWVITQGVGAWSYIGSEGPYYTKSQVDTELNDKLDKDFSNADVGQATAGQVLVVNSSANGVEFVTPTKELPTIATGDAGKVLAVNSGETGVEWQSIIAGGGYEFVEKINKSSSIIPNSPSSLSYNVDINYDYIIITQPLNDVSLVAGLNAENVSSVSIRTYNKSGSTSNIGFKGNVYRRPKVTTNNIVNVVGSVGNDCVFVPLGGLSGQVFKKTSSDYAKGSWQTLNEVPSSSASDVGKVLGVTAANTYGWVTAGGGSVSPTEIYDLSSINVMDFCVITIIDASYKYYIVGMCLVKEEIAGEYTFSGVCITDYNNSISISSTIVISNVDLMEGYKL